MTTSIHVQHRRCLCGHLLCRRVYQGNPSFSVGNGRPAEFPIIIMQENRTDFFYTDVIGEVYEAIFRNRANDNDFIDTIASLVSRLPENRNIATLMRLISDNLKCTFLLSDASLNNVCLSKWPMSNDITADTISALLKALPPRTNTVWKPL